MDVGERVDPRIVEEAVAGFGGELVGEDMLGEKRAYVGSGTYRLGEKKSKSGELK